MKNVTQVFEDGIDREVLIDKNKIKARVCELGIEISKDYNGKRPVVVGILKGSFIFLADLARELDTNLRPVFDFMVISSYVGRESSGLPKIDKDLSIDVSGREVLLVEDIVDNGYCIDSALKHLRTKSPGSIKVCSLLSKPSRRKINVDIDYLGFEIEDKWVEGYGLDTDQENRHLPDIWYRKV